jgi:hypothetical protein
MQAFTPHDQSSPCRHVGQINEAGDLRDMGAFSDVAVGSQCWLPGFVRCCAERLDLLNRGLDSAVCAGHDRETDVSCSATVDEPVRATGRISADLHSAGDERHVVADMVAGSDSGG